MVFIAIDRSHIVRSLSWANKLISCGFSDFKSGAQSSQIGKTIAVLFDDVIGVILHVYYS